MTMPVLWVVIIEIVLILLALYTWRQNVRLALLRRKLGDAYHKQAETARFMDLFSRNLSASEGGSSEWMNITARYIGDLVEAQAVCIFGFENGKLHAVGVYGAFPSFTNSTISDYVLTKSKYLLDVLKKEYIPVGQGFIGEIAEKREDVYLQSPGEDPRIAETARGPVPIRTLMAVPLIRDGRVTGVMCAVNSKGGDRPFSPEQFARFKFIASQVVLAQNIFDVYAALSEQQRISQELTFARNLQLSMIPTEFPVWGKFRVHAFTRACKEVSGDFYDFIRIDDDRLLVVIGDACGKGIPACMIMAMTRTFIRSNIDRFISLNDMLVELNDNIYRDTLDERYVTLGCCLLDRKEASMEYARAGHTPLLIHLRNHIRTVSPEGSGIGLLPSELATFDTINTEVRPNTKMLLFTDGINEALNGANEQFGIPRLTEVYRSLCEQNTVPEKIIPGIMESLDAFTDNKQEQDDDQTMVIIEYK